jgi:hypothetical protein
MVCPFDGTEIVPGYTVCKTCGATYMKHMGSGWQCFVVFAMFAVVFIPAILAWVIGAASGVPALGWAIALLIPVGVGVLVWVANHKIAQYKWVRRVG